MSLKYIRYKLGHQRQIIPQGSVDMVGQNHVRAMPSSSDVGLHGSERVTEWVLSLCLRWQSTYKRSFRSSDP